MIGVGIDAVDVERFRQSLARTPGLAERLFTADERAYAARRADPTERLAVRFAAKEAVMKALGVGIGAFAFHDVEVVVTDDGAAVARAAWGGEGAGRRAWRARLAPVAHPHRAGRRGGGDRRVGAVARPATPSVEPYDPCHRGSPQGYKRCRGWGERPHPTTGRANRGGRSRIPRWRVERVPGLSSRSVRPPRRAAGAGLAPSAQRPVPRPPRRAPVRYETGDLHRHARGDAGHRRCGSRTRRGPHRAGRSRRGPRRPSDARAAPTGAGSSWWPARATTATTGVPRPGCCRPGA